MKKKSYTVEHPYNTVGFIGSHDYMWRGNEKHVPYRSGYELTKDISPLMGELWNVLCEYFGEKWSCYKQVPLIYIDT